MNVCILAPEFLPSWGGVGTYIVELARHLPGSIEVHIVTPMREGFGNEKASTLDYDFSRYFGHNVHVHFVCNANDTFFYNARFQYACLKHVPKIVEENRIDLILSHMAHMPDLLLMLRKLGKPIVTTIHTTIKSQRIGTLYSGTNMHGLERSEKATWILYPALRLIEETYFRRKRFYITPSNWMKRWVEGNFSVNGNIRVIPNSIDINDYTSNRYTEMEIPVPRDLRNRRIILYVGRLLAMKGVNILVKAIPKILMRSSKNELLFVFAGPGDSWDYLDEIKRMGVESQCLFTGTLPREKVKQLMTTAEFVVVPSFIENMPYTVLESMACGTPVIASSVGGIPEIINDGVNGILVPSGSTNRLADSATTLLQDKGLRNLFGHQARKTITDKFSWSANLREYVDCYKDAINHS